MQKYHRFRRPTGCTPRQGAARCQPACERGLCAASPHGLAARREKVEQLGSANSFSAPAAAWPGDGWWQRTGIRSSMR